MSFRGLVYDQIPKEEVRTKGNVSEVNTAQAIYINKGGMSGKEEAIYHVSLIDLLDKVFLFNALHFLSREQEDILNRFFKEADVAVGILKNNKENLLRDDPFEYMSDIMKQLDNFLGSYYGEESDVRFTR